MAAGKTLWNVLYVGRLLGSIVALLLSLTNPCLRAQVDAGSLTGTVADASKAAIPGSTVTLTNNSTGVSSTATTSDTGLYLFEALKPGTYTLKVVGTGFKAFTSTGVDIHVQQRATIDVALEPGSVTDVIDVTAAAPLLQAEDASIGQTIESETVNNMPLNGRDWVSLGQIAAGVTTKAGGSANDAAYNVNGINSDQNDFRLDGIDDNVEQYGGTSGTGNASIVPPPDAIQEFKLQTGDFSAEFGHSTGGIVNAVIKSGGNQIHGNLWEYVRNNIFDANDYFSKQNGIPIQEYRQNQFGGTVGGPVYIPKVYNGRDKTFFFFDYQGTRIIQPISATSTVPTASMVSSGFTNLQDLLAFNNGTRTDGLERTFSIGTVLDPATTRAVAAGALDPLTGLTNTSGAAISVRDPFYTGGSVLGIRNFVPLAAQLNHLPAGRLDPNIIKLLGVYPAPNRAGFASNYFQDAKSSQNINQYDIRIDQNFNNQDTLFGVYSSSHRVLLQPGTLPGIADGQIFGTGTNDSPHHAVAVGYSHAFNANLLNEFHFGLNRDTDNVVPLEATTSGIPAQYGIQGIQNATDNGGLPPIDIGGLSNIGVATYIPTIRTVQVYEFSDNLNKSLGSQNLRAGYQLDIIDGNITQPPFGKGFFAYNGEYTTVPNTVASSTASAPTGVSTSAVTGISDALLTPAPSSVGGPANVGGLSSISASNFAGSNDRRYYMGAYFQDDWKPLQKLTLNLGIRWDFTSPYEEINGRQANFIASGGNGLTGTYYIPQTTCSYPRSASFSSLTAKDGIGIQCTSLATGNAQHTNFAPRLGFAYRLAPNAVVRGGYGIAYGALQNIGYGGTLGTNYPFLYSVSLTSPNSSTPITLPNGQIAQVENSVAALNISDPAALNASGLSLVGRQFNFQTPYTQTTNLTVQYQLDKSDSIQAGYVGSLGRHLDVLGMHNSPSQAVAPGANIYSYIPFPDFSPNSSYESTNGASNYNAAQVVFTREMNHGIWLIANYTYSKCMSDAAQFDSSFPGYRAEWLPGFNLQGDTQLCDSDATHVVHASGTFALPIGRDRSFLSNSNRIVDAVIGGWSLNYLFVYQSGQPFTVNCPIATSAFFGCYANVVPGQGIYTGAKTPSHWLNANAFANPAILTGPPTNFAFLGGEGQQARGPSYENVDASLFKQFPIYDKTHLEFRAEAFNLTNTTHFGQPGNLDFTNATNFSQITSLRGNPRLLQLALKLYF